MRCSASMTLGILPPLASIAAVRPVFLIVMGISLMVIAWRLAANSGPWTARFLVAGALLLGFGYAVLLPMYESGTIRFFAPDTPMSHVDAGTLAWHVVKMAVMNTGWLVFGLGVAMHANVFGISSPGSHPQPVRFPHRHDAA